MFHLVKFVAPLPELKLSVQFCEGVTKIYDVRQLFDQIPIFKLLEKNHKLFNSVRVAGGGFGIIWNEDIDLSCFDTLGEVVKYPFSNAQEARERTKDADVVILNKVEINEQTIGDADHLKLVCVTATGTNKTVTDHLFIKYSALFAGLCLYANEPNTELKPSQLYTQLSL